jgi:hypothetical protein
MATRADLDAQTALEDIAEPRVVECEGEHNRE